ncbi:MAG: RsmE family RNA methyltransferase [Flavobacteriales bacterium]
MHVFFCEIINEGVVELNNEESLHATKVLRLKTGDDITLINGKGCIALATIDQVHDKHTTVNVHSINLHEPLKHRLHLAVAPNKTADRFEWMLEKITELGVSMLTPIISNRTIRHKIKQERIHKIILSAAKQSMNPWLPIINPAIDFEEFIGSCKSDDFKLIAHCIKDKKHRLIDILQSHRTSDTIVLIGPEGDFTNQEVVEALKNNFLPIDLGNNRLRSETASIFVASSFKLLSGY